MHNALMLHEANYLRHLSNFCFNTKAKIALDMVILLVPCAKQGAKLKWPQNYRAGSQLKTMTSPRSGNSSV